MALSAAWRRKKAMAKKAAKEMKAIIYCGFGWRGWLKRLKQHAPHRLGLG